MVDHLLNNWAKYFHVVIRFSVSFASVSIPLPPIPLINWLSQGHSDFVLYFSSVNVLGLGFTFKSFDFFQLISVLGVKYYLSFSLQPKIYLMD